MIELNDKAFARFVEPALKGKVRLGIPDDYIARFLPRVLADFSSRIRRSSWRSGPTPASPLTRHSQPASST